MHPSEYMQLLALIHTGGSTAARIRYALINVEYTSSSIKSLNACEGVKVDQINAEASILATIGKTLIRLINAVNSRLSWPTEARMTLIFVSTDAKVANVAALFFLLGFGC